jgi:molybdenum cofactor cytidylyltransferase
MPPAFGAHPELVGRPGHSRSRIAELHLRPAALTTNVQTVLAHGHAFYQAAAPRRRLGYDRIVIPAIVLAAGLSTRMGGRSKALLEMGERETFLTRIIHAFHDAGVNDVAVVVGHDAEAVRRSLLERRIRIEADSNEGMPPGSNRGIRLVVNPAYQSGQLSSLIAGLNAIDSPGVRAMLMTLVDVPAASSATIRRVIDRYLESNAPVVRPVHGDQHGHPVLIDRRLFDELRKADPAEGAKPIVRAYVSEIGNVAVDDEGAFFDVDTPADYARLRRLV